MVPQVEPTTFSLLTFVTCSAGTSWRCWHWLSISWALTQCETLIRLLNKKQVPQRQQIYTVLKIFQPRVGNQGNISGSWPVVSLEAFQVGWICKSHTQTISCDTINLFFKWIFLIKLKIQACSPSINAQESLRFNNHFIQTLFLQSRVQFYLLFKLSDSRHAKKIK